MKPTLVTGANGHVGTNICRLLVERREPVRAMIRPSADPKLLETMNVEIVRGDIMDEASTAAAVAGCGRVYHTAAGFLMWAKDPERDIIRPSVEGTRIVLEAAAKVGVGSYQRHVFLCTGPSCCTPEVGMASWEVASLGYPARCWQYSLMAYNSEKHRSSNGEGVTAARAAILPACAARATAAPTSVASN